MPKYIDKDGMFLAFKLMGQDALGMSHYDLSENAETPYTAEDWKQFLSEPDVQEYIKKEMEIIRTSQMNKIVQESSSSRSVGQAQLLNTLKAMDKDTVDANGPIIIYTYVPLTEEQMFAPNVKVMEIDEFGRPKTNT